MENLNISQFITKLNSSEVKRGLIPTEMSAGWPGVTIKNGNLCITIPYFKETLGINKDYVVYPISYSITAIWPQGTIVDFTRYSFSKDFKDIDFSTPLGTAKHKSIETMTKSEYLNSIDILYSYYDELISCINNKKPFPNEKNMQNLLTKLMHPSLLPMYNRMCPKFFGYYCDK